MGGGALSGTTGVDVVAALREHSGPSEQSVDAGVSKADALVEPRPRGGSVPGPDRSFGECPFEQVALRVRTTKVVEASPGRKQERNDVVVALLGEGDDRA